jgi:chaperone LolA
MIHLNIKHSLMATVVLCFLLFTAALAQEPPIVTMLKQKYGKDAALEVQFNLEIFWKIREKTEHKTGALFVGPKDRFRLELDKTVWVSDGRTYWQYSKATGQVVIKHLQDIDLSMHPSQVINTYLNSFTFVIKEQNEQEAVLSGKPAAADKTAEAREVTLWVDAKKAVLKKLFVVDKNGNESTYTFTKTRIGADIAQSTFTFKVPEGASVLDTRN